MARILSRFNRLLGRAESQERAKRLSYPDAGHGFDPFGLNPEFVALGDTIARPMYENWFRVKSYDVHHVPASGPAILAANHSGTLPFDAMMLWTDVFRNTEPPRAPRAVADYFVSTLPFISTLFARCGVVSGSRGNVRALLKAGELLMLFPEGTPGIGKPFKERYQLQEWRKGHCEMAIRFGAPIVPVGIVGAEEQMPQIAAIPTGGRLPMPYLPVPATLFPLPVRYHILYGEPIPLHEEFSTSDADNPEIVAEAALRVKAAVKALLDKGLAAREGIFT